MKKSRQYGAVTLALGLAVSMGACSANNGGDEGTAQDTELTVWTPHNTPQRLAVQEQVAADFTEATGIDVNVVGLAAAEQNQSVVAGAAAGDLPDIALVGPDQVASWASQGLLNTDAAQSIVSSLDESTFSEEALNLVTVDGAYGAVPSDGWGELLYYRTDVFEQLGLDAPSTLEDVVTAAETISDSDLGMTGIVLGTQPADAMSRENLEHISLANGCHMFDGSEVALDSPQCVTALSTYQRLSEASVAGDQNVESTRAAYLAGEAAMVMWSPHLLDEIAGLDANFPVSCEQCADDPNFLASNTGVVGPLTGPDNSEGTGYGLTMNMAVLQGANEDAASQYIDFVLNEGYIDTLAMTPEGRAPVRTGTPEEPNKYLEEWKALPLGADPANQRPFNEAFSSEVADTVLDAANSFTRWGFGTENWATAGAAASQNSLVTDLNMLLDGGSPEEYAQHIAEITQTLKQENS
ncbi:extracellular solute-binding protein [Arthrobacter tumbae]|uniref:ABC transporter substrate-binding protein n=1 Tax=Arthrobacter tumbae TaxID=163874 RepID=UPI00195C00D5|nr:extracellular solute-binding protein [Arthrobacter tumbae]MBM7781752.1 multiple sugar transport system substrate-binding protein [Arthrobacter tumbae]